jgi:hypothetical protein
MHTESQWENTQEGHIISRSLVKLSPLLQEPVMATGQDWVPSPVASILYFSSMKGLYGALVEELAVKK